MNKLILNSLEIRNFRGFQHLTVERLGRVNLIVGKNNIGKSSLLEALQLYAQRGDPTLIWELIRGRDESRYFAGARDESSYSPQSRSSSDRPTNVEDQLFAIKNLFYGRKDIKSPLESIQIGAIDSPDELISIAIGWYVEEMDEQIRPKRRLLQAEQYSLFDEPEPRFTIQIGKRQKIDYPLNPSPVAKLVGPDVKEFNHIFRPANGLARRQVGKLWDSISLTPLEKDVLSSIRVIAPGVEGISLVEGAMYTRERIPIVKIVGNDDPLPLRSLGDGMQRMLEISLTLVNAKDGILLIDEIENGIHYSAQTELWELIFQLAHRLNVQVFATTHSWDCIEGFQKAAQENTEEEGMLIRLSLLGDDVIATLFDERKLSIAAREQIEVRS
jgi:AAA domain, putative AbiEii toxin, Type IV TA system